MKKAVVVDKLYGSASLEELAGIQEKLARKGIALELYHCTNEDEIIACARDAEAMICTGNPPITEKVLRSLPELKTLIRLGIGYNSVDLNAATKYDKVIQYMPGYCVNELAVHATALFLSLNRNVGYYDSRIRKGGWPKAEFYAPRSPKLMTIGLFGFGGSGREMYQIYRHGFGSQVLACDPYLTEADKSQFDVTFVDFDTLLRESDMISIHAPLNAETYHAFDAQAFRKMKKDAVLINVARGGIVDQKALEAALEAGEIRFAGMDVFEQEPLPADSPLKQRDDVVMTCHSAFFGEESKQRQLQWVYEMTELALDRRVVEAKKVANPDVIEKNTWYEFV
jgi:D-3-phosphoglycerate dehydrogenase